MIGELQLGLDAVVDSLAGVSLHFVAGVGPAVDGEDEGEECDECDNFHDDIQIQINLISLLFIRSLKRRIQIKAFIYSDSSDTFL